MLPTALERFRAWTAAEIPGGGLRRFRIAFASIWLAYDVLDLALGGTAASFTFFAPPHPLRGLALLQLGLIAAETGLLIGRGARAFALAACALRAAEAGLYFPLNDFYCFCVVALILSQARLKPAPARELAWPRDVLLGQAAWIYFATALLKTSRVWLSGGHLFVRHQYLLAAWPWPYPAPYRALVSSLGGNAVLAWMGLLGELTMAGLLAFRGPRRAALALAIALHGYAALALDVWFFGASMIAMVAFLPPGRETW